MITPTLLEAIPPNIAVFYGLTTTTIIVLVSASTVLFGFIRTRIQEKIEIATKDIRNIREQIKNIKLLQNEQENSNFYILLDNYESDIDNISNVVEPYSKDKLYRVDVALLLCIVLCAITLSLVPIKGLFNCDWINLKLIFCLNMLTLISYGIISVIFIYQTYRKRKRLIKANKDLDISNRILLLIKNP